MSSVVYPYCEDIGEVSLHLLWNSEWPDCRECGGPLMRSKAFQATVQHTGKCMLEGNVYDGKVTYVAIVAHFYCVCCAEYHNISWYFFYKVEQHQSVPYRYHLHSHFHAVISVPRIGIDYINPDTRQLLRGMRLE